MYGYSPPSGWDSEYDSTWEEDEEDGEPKSKKMKTSHQNWGTRAARDMQNYRRGYPDDSYKPNLLFYQNQIRFQPHGEYIDNMHNYWRNDYYTLETNHNFIQWLFPLREPGVNRQATPLTLMEIQMMKMDKQVMKRLLESYKLMLGFYGIVLLDEDTGDVARAEHNWEERFHNLNTHTHNNLRITRILKCLGEMGYEKFQAPLVMFFLEETLSNGNLPNVKKSALDYFMFTVKDKKERQRLVHFAWEHYTPQDRFIWGPVEKLQNFNARPEEAEICDVRTSEIASSEEFCVEVSGEEPQPNIEGMCSLVRRAPGYIGRPFWAFLRLFSRPFLFLFRPFRYFFTGWFRGERRNPGKLNEENSEKAESPEAEIILLLNSPEQESHKAYVKKPDGQSDDSTKESEDKTKPETEANGNVYDSVPGYPELEPSIPITGGSRNQDTFNEEPNVGTGRTESENSLLDNPVQQEHHDTEVKMPDDAESELEEHLVNIKGESCGETEGTKTEITLLHSPETEFDGSEYNSVPGYNKSVHGEPLVPTGSPIRRLGKEDDNSSEDEDNSRNLTHNTKSENELKSDWNPTSGDKEF